MYDPKAAVENWSAKAERKFDKKAQGGFGAPGLALRLQVASRRSFLHVVGPKVGVVLILGALWKQFLLYSLQYSRHQLFGASWGALACQYTHGASGLFKGVFRVLRPS